MSNYYLRFKQVINQFRALPYLVKYTARNPLKFYKFFSFAYLKYLKKRPFIINPANFNDFKMVLDLNSNINRTIFFHGGSYPYHLSFIKKHLKTDSVFFDIGAHSGFFSIYSATIIKKGSIHAFEPIPHLCHDIYKSIQINRIKNIKVNQFCLGNRDGKVKFNMSAQLDLSGIEETHLQFRSKVIKTKIMKLATYCRRNKIKKIDMIKIDVEGGEKDILFPAESLLRKFMPVIIAEFSVDTTTAFNYHPNELYDFLDKLGYKMYGLVNGRLKEVKKKFVYREDIFCLPGQKGFNE